MKVYNPENKKPKWTLHKEKEVAPWWAAPLGVAMGLGFCLLWPLWIFALLFLIAPFTGWNPSHKKEGD